MNQTTIKLPFRRLETSEKHCSSENFQLHAKMGFVDGMGMNLRVEGTIEEWM